MEKNIRCARGHIFEYLNFVFRVLRAQAQAVKKCPLQSTIYMLRIAPILSVTNNNAVTDAVGHSDLDCRPEERTNRGITHSSRWI